MISEINMNRMITWNERQYFSLDHDAEVARISGFDQNHQEFWSIIETGKGYRDRRDEALQVIMSAIEDGNEPGQVFEDEKYHEGE